MRLFSLRVVALAVLAGCTGRGERAPDTTSTIAESSAGDVRLPSDPRLADAAKAMREGRPFRAWQLLAPALRDPSRRTPETLLLAAEAAQAWGGSEQVERLLGSATWVDTRANGVGRELLAIAALDRKADTLAARHAARAVAVSRTTHDRGRRRVLYARALDRLERRDSAAAQYAQAASELPSVADWLWLRAAGVRQDSAARAADYAHVGTAVARARIPWTEAAARERTGDAAGAARAYAALGEAGTALRLRVAAIRGDSSQLGALRREAVALVREHPGSDDARMAIELLDQLWSPLTIDEELAVAHSADGGAGPLARAATAYQRAFAASSTPLSTADRLKYASVLSRLGRDSDAAAQLALVPSSDPLAAVAGFQRGRALVRARQSGATEVLRDVVARFPNDTAAGAALMLLADLAIDSGRDADARAAYLDVARRFPRSERAASALFQAGVISYVSGDERTAGATFDSVVARWPQSDETNAAIYWAGRSFAKLGDSARARQRWRSVIERDPVSYYSSASARRLGESPWSPPPAADVFPRVPAVDSAMRRIDLLDSLGMDVEQRHEYDRLVADAEQSTDRMLATANALRSRGQTSRAIQLAYRAIARGAPKDARTYRLIYPLVQREVLAAEARTRGLDPALVAALIRQESSFNPRATSRVGARGLMQLMPDVGAQIARGMSIREWSPVLLWQPDVNVQLGTRHLAGLVGRYGPIEHVLAAYNAGERPVARWDDRAGASDPELFTERIPYAETRDYVRIVQRNRDFYRALYGW